MFKVDYSAGLQQAQNSGQALTGLANAISGYKDQQAQAQQQDQAQQQQAQIKELVGRAAKGDPDAVDQLYTVDPEIARQLEERIIESRDYQQTEKSRTAKERDLATAQVVEQIALAKTDEEKAAIFEASKDDPDVDVFEHHRQIYLDPAKQRQALTYLAGEDRANFIFGAPVEQEKPSNFAPQVSALQVDPETGQKYVAITNRNTGEVKRVDAANAIGETLTQEQDRLFRKESLKDARAISKESFTELKNVKKSIGTINEAITAIDKGAESGFIDKFLPSFRESTIALENASQRMGLDIISATTFGALSEGELRLAMDTAVPKNLEPKELKIWLQDRKKAKLKLSNELGKMAIELGKGKTTIAEYLEKNASFSGGNQQSTGNSSGSINDQALKWANENPNDPRSQQILQRIKGQ